MPIKLTGRIVEMRGLIRKRSQFMFAQAALLALCSAGVSLAQGTAKPAGPWLNPAKTPEQRAELALAQMTLDEKISLLHGEGMRDWQKMSAAIVAVQNQSNGGAGFVLGVPRLGIPSIQMSDAAYGVRASAENGRYSTALPSNLASAASWDPGAACEYGALIGRELRAQGYNMTLGGGTNLTREPRNGRTFEYMGEDPVLAGNLVGQRIRCEGEQHVISDIKHVAMNDQENGRTEVDVQATDRTMRESDLLAFEIGIEVGHPKAVMCSYNGVNGTYACENPYLLTEVLKRDWRFKGFVVSDWGATHSTAKASAAGLDQEQPLDTFYGEPLKAAVQSGKVPMREIDDHVRRVLWAEFASGIVDDHAGRSVIDPFRDLKIAREVEAGSAVLLRNQAAVLPLQRDGLHSIAVIGLHADTGMISGGGSAQVDPPGQPAGRFWRQPTWFPTSPLDALRDKAPGAAVSFNSGVDIAAAVKAAKAADVAVVFAWQWEAEGEDLPSLSLPEGQDKLIEAVAAANPKTVVVLESGTAVTMPWLGQTAAVLEAWYGGSDGAHAVADVLFGNVNPSGKLPMTFPRSEADLPRLTVAQPPPRTGQPGPEGGLTFKVDYSEGAKVGYKWYETQHKPVLFPFGFGLSYTTFRYSGLKMSPDGSTVTFTVTNSGSRKGAEVAELYGMLPLAAKEPWKRLLGWSKVELGPGESHEVTLHPEARALSVWDTTARQWSRPAGSFSLMVGGSSDDLPLRGQVSLP